MFAFNDKMHKLLHTGNGDLWRDVKGNLSILGNRGVQCEFVWVKAHATKHQLFSGSVSEAGHFGNTLAGLF